MTTMAINRCSPTTRQGFVPCSLPIAKLKSVIKSNPHKTLMIIATDNENNNTGIKNVRAKKNLAKKVIKVDSQISFVVCLFSDSSEIWIPRASENASAIAMVRIPPITTILEWVPECNPTIKPRVVIIPDVEPKLKPVFKECLSINPFWSFWSI